MRKIRYTEDPEAVAAFDKEVKAYYRDVTHPFLLRMQPPRPPKPARTTARPARRFRHGCCCRIWPINLLLAKLADRLWALWQWNH